MRLIKFFLIFAFAIICFSERAFALKKFSGLYVFGDSLSSEEVINTDMSNGQGSGNNWPYFFEQLILSADGTYENNAVPGQRSWGTLDTINAFLSIHPSLDPDAIYIIFSGINDGDTKAENVAEGVTILKNAGAEYILVSNLHDCPRRSHAVIDNFNSDLENKISITGANVILADTNSLVHELSDDPSLYGINDVLSDRLHFSTKTSEIIADYFQSLIDAPQIISMLPEFPKHLVLNHNKLIDMYSTKDGLKNQEKLISYFIDFNSSKTALDASENSVSGDMKNSGASLGLDYKVTEKILAGFGLGFGINNDGNFGENRGSFTLESRIISFFADYNFDRVSVDFIISKGAFNFDKIIRNVVLGDYIRECTGSTKADTTGYAAKTKVTLYKNKVFSCGPEIGIDSETIAVDSYAEDDLLSTGMNFSEQEVKALIACAGIFCNYKTEFSSGTILYFAKVLYEDDVNKDAYSIRAGINNIQDITYEMPGYEPRYGGTLFNIGADFDITERISGIVSYSYRNGEKSTENNINLGIRF